jgi:hypothetical protein
MPRESFIFFGLLGMLGKLRFTNFSGISEEDSKKYEKVFGEMAGLANMFEPT